MFGGVVFRTFLVVFIYCDRVRPPVQPLPPKLLTVPTKSRSGPVPPLTAAAVRSIRTWCLPRLGSDPGQTGSDRVRPSSGLKPLCRKRQLQSAAMTRVALLPLLVLVLVLLGCQTDGLHLRGDSNFSGTASDFLDVSADADLSSAVRRVDRRFLSVTIDASLASEEKFMYLLRWESGGAALKPEPGPGPD